MYLDINTREEMYAMFDKLSSEDFSILDIPKETRDKADSKVIESIMWGEFNHLTGKQFYMCKDCKLTNCCDANCKIFERKAELQMELGEHPAHRNDICKFCDSYGEMCTGFETMLAPPQAEQEVKLKNVYVTIIELLNNDVISKEVYTELLSKNISVINHSKYDELELESDVLNSITDYVIDDDLEDFIADMEVDEPVLTIRENSLGFIGTLEYGEQKVNFTLRNNRLAVKGNVDNIGNLVKTMLIEEGYKIKRTLML